MTLIDIAALVYGLAVVGYLILTIVYPDGFK